MTCFRHTVHMGRSGSRESALRALLTPEESGVVHPGPARLHALPPALQESIQATFRDLGGEGDLAATGPRGWDIVLGDGLVVELDEEQHFTPYRAATLAAPWSSVLPWAPDYTTFCALHASAAARNAQHWTKPAPERLFGPPGPVGDFDGPGSPRGKQRALFDAIRDATAAAGAIRLARISVYDSVAGVLLGEALSRRGHLDTGALIELVRARTTPA